VNNKINSKVILTLLLLVFSFTTLKANVTDKSLFNANTPIIYGQELFIKRLAENKEERIGLVLSGGSARAFAHIGVLRYLEESEISIDYIVSNSMGSIVGLLYAAGLSPDQIEYVIKSFDVNQLFSLTFPFKNGLLNVDQFINLVESIVGFNLNIEDLRIPIMIVTEDLVTKRQVQIMQGPLADVLKASFALPVYFSPVEYKQHLLIDGGITNLAPLEIAYNYSNNVIVSTTFYEGKDLNLKNPLTTLNVSIDIGKRREGFKELVKFSDAIWIRCDVENFSFMDFKAVDELSFKGYQSAKEQNQKLEKLPKRVLSEEISISRVYHDKNINEVFKNFDLYQRSSLNKFSNQLFFSFHPLNGDNQVHFLRDDLVLGLKYQFRFKEFFLATYGGASWLSHYPMEIFPSLGLTGSLRIFNSFLLEGDFLLSGEKDIGRPKFYYHLDLKYRNKFLDNRISTTVKASFEQQLNQEFKFEEILVSSGLTFRYDLQLKNPFFVEGEVAYQLAGQWDEHYIYNRIDSSIALSESIYLALGYTARYNLKANATTPIYIVDGFKTSYKTIYDSRITESFDGGKGGIIVGRIGLDYQPKNFKPTAAEALIFEDSAIGIFGDILKNGLTDSKIEYVVGLKLRTKSSLIGLYSLPVSLYVGYDSLTNNIAWGFIIGRQ
jgi:NTE family protein